MFWPQDERPDDVIEEVEEVPASIWDWLGNIEAVAILIFYFILLFGVAIYFYHQPH